MSIHPDDPRRWQPRSELIRRAEAYARDVHRDDVRKGSGTSYADGHLVPVAAIVEADGGDDVQVAAALLHDTAEDHGGERRLADVRARFGDEVAAIVADLSDSLVDTERGEEKAAWRTRKEAYLASLEQKPTRSLVVAAADKAQNAASIVEDHARLGDELWERFTTRSGADQRWYYESMLSVLEPRLAGHPTLRRLADAVAELRDL